jgi:LEA14-like dessication related protein
LRTVSKAVVIILVILIIGLGINFYQLSNAYDRLEIRETELMDAKLEGINPLMFDFIPEEIIYEFRVLIHNPSDYPITVDEMRYQVYVESFFLGEGIEQDISVPANSETPLYFTVITETGDTLRVMADIIFNQGDPIEYEIKGYLVVPLKLFGIVQVTTVDVPFEKTGNYRAPI